MRYAITHSASSPNRPFAPPFQDRLVNRHVTLINPTATVRAERYASVEGKTPEIQRSQVARLLKSIPLTYTVKSQGPKKHEPETWARLA